MSAENGFHPIRWVKRKIEAFDERTKQKVQDAIEDGATTSEEVMKKTGLSPTVVDIYLQLLAHEGKIKLLESRQSTTKTPAT